MYRGGSFQREFRNIGEARSIIPRCVNLMAMTATATRVTREAVQLNLCMSNCYVIMKPPYKLNIKYMVGPKPDDPGSVLLHIVDNVKARGISANKCIIFCPTYPDCLL